jgi:hypothetical protein
LWKKYGAARQAADDNMTHRMLFECWIREAKDISEYAIIIAFHSTKWLRERASVLHYSTLPHLLGAFEKLRKATLIFDMSVCLSVCLPACLPVCLSVLPSFRMEKLRSKLTNCHKLRYLGIFRKSVDQIQVSLKSDKNDGYCT